MSASKKERNTCIEVIYGSKSQFIFAYLFNGWVGELERGKEDKQCAPIY